MKTFENTIAWTFIVLLLFFIYHYFRERLYAIDYFPYAPYYTAIFLASSILFLLMCARKINFLGFSFLIFFFIMLCYLAGAESWRNNNSSIIYKGKEKQKIAEQKAYLSTPIGTLETRLHEIKDLKKDLYFKWEQIGKILPEFEKEISDLNSTIISYKNKNGIRTYEEAKRHRTINESLEHIQRKQAYVDELKKVHSRIASGWNQADFLEKKTTDDLKLMHALGDQNTKDLVKKIASLFKEFQPYTGELVIEGKNTKPLKTIWDEINR